MKTLSAGNEVPDDLDYTDPTRKYKNLEFLEHRNMWFFARHFDGPDRELCWSCGWNTRNQKYSFYGSRVRVMHTRANTGIWALGTRWILRDEPNDRYLGNNYMTLKFLHEQPGSKDSIPTPQEVRSLSKPGDPIYLTLESRVPGDTLMEVWPSLSREEKASYSRQLTDILRKMRQFTAPRPQRVDGSQLNDNILGVCLMSRPGNCFKIPYSVDEWLDGLGPDLRIGLTRVHNTLDPAVIEEKFQALKAGFPSCEPYVFTHGDLNLSNIIVKDGKIQGIVDWEHAGYYPWWAERRATDRIPNDDAYELFDPVWEELMPDIDRKKWVELVYHKLFPAEQAWGHCDHGHPGVDTVWWRPSFCECHPVQGEFRAHHWGMPLSCEVNQLNAGQQALLDRYRRKDPWAQEHDEKDARTLPAGEGDDSK
ncbi:hypothetical protein PV08_05846 [Exophiala spinifera]|uniref:Aminoglycoside phosphotransferase domain-containing protein n=1 Tax=Exophiala spinifera TaxID=91928 RepID=A0A0D1YL74_9EURO|nr:uncharacterized protein PV08_05846 [Exophiala spinifera]KIW15796.1 hypothetical protein PV08_05846 [Exophiala spinifera]